MNLRPWLDEENLLPGQDWHEEVRKAIEDSLVILVCLSNKSVSKTGYVQKEIKYALDVADEYPMGEIFLIPVRLETCMIPRQLDMYQWVDLFDEKGFDKLLKLLRFKLMQKYGGISTLLEYAEELYLSAGYEDLSVEIHDEMVKDIFARSQHFLFAKLFAALSDEDAATLDKMVEQDVSEERIQEFFLEKIPNAPNFINTVLLEFRAIYLGLSQ